jgi:hypothetical protein
MAGKIDGNQRNPSVRNTLGNNRRAFSEANTGQLAGIRVEIRPDRRGKSPGRLRMKKVQPPARELAGRLKTNRKSEASAQSSKPKNRAMEQSRAF